MFYRYTNDVAGGCLASQNFKVALLVYFELERIHHIN